MVQPQNNIVEVEMAHDKVETHFQAKPMTERGRLNDLSNITLAELEERFSLHRSPNPNFFDEIEESLPDLSELEKVALNRVKQNF